MTLMPDGSHFAGEDVCGQDKEWLTYWWSMLSRHLPGPGAVASSSSSSRARDERWKQYMGSAATGSAITGKAGKRKRAEAGPQEQEAKKHLTKKELRMIEAMEAGQEEQPDPAAGVGLWPEHDEAVTEKQDGNGPMTEEILDSQNFLHAEVAKIEAVHARLWQQRAAEYQAWADDVMKDALGRKMTQGRAQCVWFCVEALALPRKALGPRLRAQQ